MSTPAVTLTSNAAGAQHVTYVVVFTTSATGGIPASTGRIILTAPAGTVFSTTQSASVRDLTTGTSLSSTSSPTLSNGGATATYTVYTAVPAGHRIRATVENVTNPAAGTAYVLKVSTSADTTLVSTPTYAITAAKAVGSPGLSVSTTAAAATHVLYMVTFTASSTGALVYPGTIRLAAPAGTVFSSSAAQVTDLTTGLDLGNTYSPTLESGGAVAIYQVYKPIAAGHRIRLKLINVTNPAVGTTYALNVSTSSDTVAANTPAYAITAANAVGSPGLALSTTAGGANHVTYLVTFKASSTGTLTGDGTIRLTAPAGTVFSSQTLSMRDLTAGIDLGTSYAPTLENSGATAIYRVYTPGILAGHRIRVTANDVTNPAVGTGYQLKVATSSDTVEASTAAYAMTAPKAVTSPTAAFSTPAAGATHVNYVVTFRTTSTGGLIGYIGTIKLVAPAGTVFATNQPLHLTDLSTGADLSTTYNPTVENAGATATYKLSSSGVPAGHQIEASVANVTNPAAGSYQLKMSTSSDTVEASTANYSITAAKAVTSTAVKLSTTAGGASGVVYMVTFTTSTTGALMGYSGTIQLAGPAGTAFASNEPLRLFDASTGTDLGSTYNPTLANAGASATYLVTGNVPAGHKIEATVGNVTNPAAGSYSLKVSTSSDTMEASTPTYAITAPKAVSAASIGLASYAAGATTTYQLTFKTSSTGALAPYDGAITVAAPTGTVFGTTAAYVFDETTGVEIGSLYNPALSNGGATATYKLSAEGISAGDTIEMVIGSVKNPAAGAYHLTVSTSSDTAGSTSAAYTIT